MAARARKPAAGAAPARTRAGLDRLWSPWRMAYIRKTDEPAGCLFCRVAGRSLDAKDLVLVRNTHAMLMLNRYPYNPAHLMVAMQRHVAQFRDLTAAERVDLLDLVALAENALEAEYGPQGVNYGLNVGKVSGAGFPGHMHVHMVPRWNGDTNFMPTVAETRVLPESLTQTWRRLRAAISRLSAASGRPSRARKPARSRRGP